MCGSELPDGAVFCTNCGAACDDETESTAVLDEELVETARSSTDAEETTVLSQDDNEGTTVLEENIEETTVLEMNRDRDEDKDTTVLSPSEKEKEAITTVIPNENRFDEAVNGIVSDVKNHKKGIIVAIIAFILIVVVAISIAIGNSNRSDETGTEHTITETATNTTNELIVTESKYLVDDAGLFTDKEKNDLIKKLDSIRNEYHFDIVIHTTNTFNGKSAMEYADDYYDYNGYGYGENHDGCILVINMDSRDWWLSTSGYGITALTDSKIDNLGDYFVPKLTSGDYYDSMVTFLNQVESYL